MSIYEVHLGSWRLNSLEGNRPLTYLELADELSRYVKDMGFTHVELLPVMAPPVQRLLGLPGDGLLRARPALRQPRRAPRVHRADALERRRRDPRLGARPLPSRRVRARAVRRHGSLRARRPAPRRASRLGHARVQLRPPRGPQLPDLERPVLAARLPRRRDPGRRGRVDAVPRLLARRGRVGPEPVRRARGPRRGRVPEGVQRGRVRARAGDHHRRGGVDRVAGRLTADVPGRSRVRLQVEHGLDARHARLLPAGPDLPPLPPPRADVLADVRVQRELHPAAVPRRGRPRQGLAVLEDAGRPRGRSSRTSARSTPTCGRIRARSCCSWAASSRRSRSGATSARSTGICSSSPVTPGSSRWCAT